MNTGLLSKDWRKGDSGEGGIQDFYLKIRGEVGDRYRHTEVTLTCGALAFNVPIDSDLK